MFGVPRSLRARMLWSLLGVILFGAMIQGAVAYRSALREASQLFDYNMQQMALSMRSGTPMLNRAAAPEFEGGFGDFDFVVQVWTTDGIRIFESSPSLILPQRAVPGFSDIGTGRADYRVFSIRTSTRLIQVAQDLAVRRRLAGGLALRTVGPIAMIVPLLMLVTWWVVTRSLSPLARVRTQVASRAADDLSPVSEEGLPDEIRPLVQELNLLLGRLRTAFEAQRNFVSDAAHELRSPLAALSLQVQGLRRAEDVEGRELAASRLAAGIDRASRLIEQLLVMARQEADSAAGAQFDGVIDLGELVRQSIAEMTTIAHESGIDLGLVQEAPAARIRGEAEAVAILLRNLIDNALKYTPRGGTVDLSLQVGERIVLVVEDSGPGIDPESRERALARFDRLGGSSGAPGSGLGLAIVKTIAEQHRAELRLGRSERLGGLEVAVSFPAADYLRR